jgi:hypothetical protein
MVILGLAIGLLMQVPTLAVQNSVPFEKMGAGTSTTTFARSIGSSFGGAIFGTILISRLNLHLHNLLPQFKGSISASSLSGGTSSLGSAPAFIQDKILQAFISSFHDLFIYAIPIAGLTLITAVLLKEAPLKDAAKEYAKGEGFSLGG